MASPLCRCWFLVGWLTLTASSAGPLGAWQEGGPGANAAVASETRTFDLLAVDRISRALAPKIAAATVGIVCTPDEIDEAGVGTGGSGVIVSADGLVLTAAHVLEGCEQEVIVLLGKRRLPAKVVGYMGRGDFGVVRLAPPEKGAEPWPYLPMSQATNFPPGTLCLGAGHTAKIDPARVAPVRVGRILGERRGESFVDERGDRAELDRVLVSDAPFLPGDSGGPLVNLQGEVIGVHSSIGPDYRENLHIPITQFHKHWTKLLAGKKYGLPEKKGHDHALDAASLNGLNRTQIADYRLSVEHSWSRTHRNFLRQAAPLVPRDSSTVQIFAEDRPVALGLVVDAAGLVVTKASAVTSSPVICRCGDKDYAAERIAVNEAYDVALLKIPAQGLTPVAWPAAREPELGACLISTAPDGSPLAWSLVSVAKSKWVESQTPAPTHGFLGIELAADTQVARVARVFRDTPAKACGLQTGDEIRELGAAPVESSAGFIESLRKHKPGERVKIAFEREGKRHQVEVKLIPPPNEAWSDALEFATWNHSSGGVSVRRTGFPEYFVHDGFVAPARCGGPVYDTAGRLAGMNIARVDRTATYAIPVSTLAVIVAQLREKTR